MDETTYRALLDKQDWADIHARLLDFAISRCGKRATSQAKDLAQSAVARVFAFDSKWDPEKEPELLRYLMSVVNSLLYNERHSYAAQKNISMESKKARKAVPRVADPQAVTEDTLAEADLLARRVALLRERRADDPQVLELLDAMEAGHDSPAAIRGATGWSAGKLLAVRERMLRSAALVARDLGGTVEDDVPEDAEEDDSDDEEVP